MVIQMIEVVVIKRGGYSNRGEGGGATERSE